MSVPSRGNPLGLAVGDVAIALGNEVERQFAITRVLRSELAASTTTVTRGEPVRVATGEARRPPWIPGLVRAGLIDAPEDLPEHLWLEAPVQALAAIHEPRGALDRGFAWYSVKIQHSTKNPITDFAQMARAPTRPEPSPRPGRALTGPLAWTLGGATPARSGPAAGNGERRREPSPQRQPISAEARKRRNPSSRFRG